MHRDRRVPGADSTGSGAVISRARPRIEVQAALDRAPRPPCCALSARGRARSSSVAEVGVIRGRLCCVLARRPARSGRLDSAAGASGACPPAVTAHPGFSGRELVPVSCPGGRGYHRLQYSRGVRGHAPGGLSFLRRQWSCMVSHSQALVATVARGAERNLPLQVTSSSGWCRRTTCRPEFRAVSDPNEIARARRIDMLLPRRGVTAEVCAMARWTPGYRSWGWLAASHNGNFLRRRGAWCRQYRLPCRRADRLPVRDARGWVDVGVVIVSLWQSRPRLLCFLGKRDCPTSRRLSPRSRGRTRRG